MDFPPVLYPLHLETAAPLVLPRTEARRIHPGLEHIYAKTFAHVNFAPAEQHLCAMVLTPTKGFQVLLEQHWRSIGLDAVHVQSECLVLSLSSSLNGTAAALAGQWPDVFNAPHLNLLNCTTFVAWSARLPGESALTTIQVPVHMELNDVFSGVSGPEAAGWKWMPVVVIDGDTVAIGGFAIDIYLQTAVGTGLMARDHLPIQVYGEAALAAAARETEIHGPQPWLHHRWWDGKKWLVEAPLFGFNFPTEMGA